MNRRNAIFLAFLAFGVLLDQATKYWVTVSIPLGTGELPILPGFLSIVHARNPGAAFGMFREFEYRHWLFFGFTLIAGGVILDLVRKLPTTDRFMAGTLGLILSGAAGNAIDRVRFRYVVDFIKVYTDIPSIASWLEQRVGTSEWPSFNVADAALVVGVVLYVFHQMFLEDRPEPARPADAAAPTTVAADEEPTDLTGKAAPSPPPRSEGAA